MKSVSAPEELPYIELNLAGQEFKATPLNTQLFTFAGRTILENGMAVENSTFNHVFLHTHSEQETDDDVMRGTYVFQREIVDQMETYLIEYGFPCRINQRTVQQCDIDAYNQYIEQNAHYYGEQLPDEFDLSDWES
jgi:hypothetical protein